LLAVENVCTETTVGALFCLLTTVDCSRYILLLSDQTPHTQHEMSTTARKEVCFLCHLPIQNKLYVQEIPGVDVVKNKFVCSVHLDLCTACWGPHQSVFGGRSASDKKGKDHYWAAKAFKRGVPNAAPYFNFPSNANKELSEKERVQIRKDERPFFECCHPQCFCMKCNKPKIISRFVQNTHKALYCTCPGVPEVGDDNTEQIWDTYGSLGSSTHEEGPFALPYIFFQFMYVSLCDLTKHRTQGIKMSPTDVHLDDSWEHFLLTPKLKMVQSPADMIKFAVQDCKFFLGLRGASADLDLNILLHYIHMLFRVGHPAWNDVLEQLDALPEDQRNGKAVFGLIREKKFRIPVMSVLLWHLLKEKPWGELTGLQFSQLVNDLFAEYEAQVKSEANGFKAGFKELSYLYRTSPQIIIQGDLGLNIFGRGVKFYASPEQRSVFETLIQSNASVIDSANNVVNELTSEGSSDLHLFLKKDRTLAVNEDNPNHYKTAFDCVRGLERGLNIESEKQEYTDVQSRASLALATCQVLIDEEKSSAASLVSNDVLRATLTTDSEPEIFQQNFALKLAHAAALEDADERYISLSQSDIDNLKRGVYAKGATSSLANLASPVFKSKFQAYLNALKEAKAQDGSKASLENLDRAINDLMKQVAGDAAKLFVSKEGRVGMLLLTGKAMTRKRVAATLPAHVNDWMVNSQYDYAPENIDGRIYDAIARALENDRSMPWMISTPTFESYLEYVLENPTFENDREEINDIDELIAQSNALFDNSAANPAPGDGDWNSKFEDKCKLRNEAAMKITPPLKISLPVAEELCERLLDNSLRSEAPSTNLLNAFTAVDPEGVYNNPGLLKIITESELGVKPSESNVSQIDKMKAKLAGSGAGPAKPTKRAKDIVADIMAQNPELMKMLILANKDLIDEALAAPDFQKWLDENRDRVNALSPLEKVAFCNEAILKNKNVDPVRREALCKEILDTLTEEEKEALATADKSKLLSMLPTIDDDDDDDDVDEESIVADNVNQNEAAAHSVQKRYNPDAPVMEQAAQIVDDIRKRFKELRDLAKANGVKDPEDVGLSDNNEIIACRRGLEALHDLAMADRGPDDPEVKALRKLVNKLRALEKLSTARLCPRCNCKLSKEKCAVTIDGVTYKRCVDDNPGCTSCDVQSSSTTCISKFLGDDPACGPLHGVSYYKSKLVALAQMVLQDNVSDDIAFQCANAPEFKFWREIQQQLQDSNATPRKVKGQGSQAAKRMWANKDTLDSLYDEMSPSAAFYECLQKVSVDVSMSCCYSVVSKSHAREVLELAVLAVIAISEWTVFEDDMLVLAHTF
jgi:hypothetical protein